MRHGRCAKAAEAEGAVPVAAVVEGLGAVVVAAAVAAVVAADMEEAAVVAGDAITSACLSPDSSSIDADDRALVKGFAFANDQTNRKR